MSSTFQYRILESSWGVAIDLTAEAIPLSQYTGRAQKVSENIWLAVDVPLRSQIPADEHPYLVLGLRLVAAQVRLHTTMDLPVVIRVLNIEYGLCDYQPEGLACALMGWAAQEFKFAAPEVKVSFHRDKNHYDFAFNDAV